VPSDARFCSSCGARVVGARGQDVAPQRASEPAQAASQLAAPTSKPEEVDAPGSPPEGAASPAKAAAAVEALRDRKRGKSNLGANVLFFVAVLFAFVVAMIAWNKDAPKTTSPFMGGGPAVGAGPTSGASPPAAMPTAAPAEGGGAPFAGTIKLGPGLAAPSDATLFVVVRGAGMPDRGPPLAVKRIEHPSFPAQFEIGPDNVMMQGMPFVGPFDVTVRLDQDGNAMTREAGDLTNSAPKKANPGEQAVEIVLDKRL
jgi:hypothetical protein